MLSELILPSVQNTMEIFYYVSSRLVTFLKFIYASLHISDIFVVITVCFKLIIFFFQKFPLLFLKVPLILYLIVFRLSPFL